MIRLVALLLLCFIAAACTRVGTVGAPDRDDRRLRLAATDACQLRGRIACKSGEEGGQASLSWRQAGEVSRIRLAGPVGAGAYDLTWTPTLVSVADAGGEHAIEYTGAGAAERFLQEQLGWSFPAGSVRYWVMGLLDPAAPGDVLFSDAGMLATIRQHGWDIGIDRYVAVDGLQLPARLKMTAGEASLRIAINDWQLGTVAP